MRDHFDSSVTKKGRNRYHYIGTYSCLGGTGYLMPVSLLNLARVWLKKGQPWIDIGAGCLLGGYK